MNVRVVAIVALAMLAAGCERESRRFDPPPPGARPAGKAQAEADKGAMIAHYERNAYALATGKRLFQWYNCNGCHASGGGASGPALMDDVWIYGSDPATIYQTIAFGRPNGMPAFAGRIPEDQLWQLVAYVRSLGGLAPKDAAPNRDDALEGKPPESLADKAKPVTSTPGVSR